MKVYLAGKMTGITVEEMTGWRNEATRILGKAGIKILDPCKTGKMTKSKEIVDSNKFMIDHCDLVLAELDHKEPSLGTVCEIVYAHTKGIPVIVWGGETDIIYHPWIETMLTTAFLNLWKALDYIVKNYALLEVNHA